MPEINKAVLEQGDGWSVWNLSVGGTVYPHVIGFTVEKRGNLDDAIAAFKGWVRKVIDYSEERSEAEAGSKEAAIGVHQYGSMQNAGLLPAYVTKELAQLKDLLKTGVLEHLYVVTQERFLEMMGKVAIISTQLPNVEVVHSLEEVAAKITAE